MSKTSDLIKGSFTVELSLLQKFISAVDAITPECLLHITKGSINVIAVDTANISMVIAKLDVSDSINETTLGLDITAIKGTLKSIQEISDGAAPTRISWIPGKNPFSQPLLDIEVKSIGYHAQFETLDPTSICKEPNPPKITLKSEFSCNGDKFMNVINVCSAYSDKLRIDITKDGTCYMATKGDTHQCRIEITNVATRPARANYSADYLKDIAKNLVGYFFEAHLNTDLPLHISCIPTPGLAVQYLLAPIVETEDTGYWLC